MMQNSCQPQLIFQPQLTSTTDSYLSHHTNGPGSLHFPLKLQNRGLYCLHFSPHSFSPQAFNYALSTRYLLISTSPNHSQSSNEVVQRQKKVTWSVRFITATTDDEPTPSKERLFCTMHKMSFGPRIHCCTACLCNVAICMSQHHTLSLGMLCNSLGVSL